MEKKQKEANIEEAINNALKTWSYPSIPRPLVAKTKEEMSSLGEEGKMLEEQYAFMKITNFKTYVNLEKVVKTAHEDPQRGLNAVSKHEIGHRFCPYDTITLLILNHYIKEALKKEGLPKEVDLDMAAASLQNIFSDMCINTKLVRNGDDDLPWMYSQMDRKKYPRREKFWNVYVGSMELAWNKKIFPKGYKINTEEQGAAEKIEKIFKSDYFNKDNWVENAQTYARIMCKFLEPMKGGHCSTCKGNQGSRQSQGSQGQEQKGDGQGQEKKEQQGSGKGEGKEEKNKGQGQGDCECGCHTPSSLDNIAKNIPKEIDENTAKELAKRLAKNGTDGLPSNKDAMKEFRDIMAGYGHGNKTKASIQFYDMLSNSYDVLFAPKPFGKERPSPFQPIKWHPSMGADKLDVPYSIITGGKIIPGVNTRAWKSRRKEVFGGMEEVILNLDLYLDSSGSMPNPINEVSLPVLAAFVAAKKAHKKGAYISVTNFSGGGQHEEVEPTRDLKKIFEVLVAYFGGGTVFPVSELENKNKKDPRQVLVVTDTFLGNTHETAETIKKLKSKNKRNNVTIYAISPVIDHAVEQLREAGAEIIPGTGPEIFKKVIGKAHEVYSKK